MPATLGEFAETIQRETLAKMHAGIPARVVKYDPVKNTVDAQIVVKNALFDRDGEREYEEYPTIPSVPVLWPRAGGKIIRLPLEADDFVWLAFSDAALGEWRTTGQLSEPKDARRHSIGYAFATPGAFPDAQPLSPADAAEVAAGAMIIGEDGSSTDQIIIGGTAPGIRFGKTATSAIALAVKADAAVTALRGEIADLRDWAKTHAHPGVTTGPGTSSAPASPPPNAPTAPASTASTLVKSL